MGAYGRQKNGIQAEGAEERNNNKVDVRKERRLARTDDDGTPWTEKQDQRPATGVQNKTKQC